jgi:hypothetical protein
VNALHCITPSLFLTHTSFLPFIATSYSRGSSSRIQVALQEFICVFYFRVLLQWFSACALCFLSLIVAFGCIMLGDIGKGQLPCITTSSQPSVGFMLGTYEIDGLTDGMAEGADETEGSLDGAMEGTCEMDGLFEGIADGACEMEGILVGSFDGACEIDRFVDGDSEGA